MFRYYINACDFDFGNAITHPKHNHTPLMSMRRVIERPMRFLRNGGCHWRVEILHWLEEKSIDHCYTVHRHDYVETHEGVSYDSALDVVMLGLMREEDAVWLRFLYNILPIPEPIDFAAILTSRKSVREYRL